MANSLARSILGYDPRLKLLVAFALGAMVWHAGPTGLAAYSVIIGAFLFILRHLWQGGARIFRSYGLLVFFWMALKVFSDLMSGVDTDAALGNATILGVRLVMLLLLSLALAMSASPRQLGLAISWFLRPLLGKAAWKVALALALMVHFLPLTWQVGVQVRKTIERRCPDLRWREKMILLPQAVIRNLGQKTWNQTLAVAGRGLDCPSGWVADFPENKIQWFLGLTLLVACLALAVV